MNCLYCLSHTGAKPYNLITDPGHCLPGTGRSGAAAAGRVAGWDRSSSCSEMRKSHRRDSAERSQRPQPINKRRRTGERDPQTADFRRPQRRTGRRRSDVLVGRWTPQRARDHVGRGIATISCIPLSFIKEAGYNVKYERHLLFLETLSFKN